MRDTRTIRFVRSALGSLDRAVSAQEIYVMGRQQERGSGLASIYRALDQLVTSGEAERLRRDMEDTYVLCPPAHHHHAVCKLCGRVESLEGCGLEGRELRTVGGFQIEDHETVYYGRCPNCSASGAVSGSGARST